MRIVQPFGANPEAYTQFGLKGHNGLDFEAEDGELVVAVDDGEVVEVRDDQAGYGVTVKLLHAWGESRYAHGRRLSVPIEFRLGHLVWRGERVFLASGTHLHLGVRVRKEEGALDYSGANGFAGYEDPLPLLRAGVDFPAPTAPERPAASARSKKSA